MKAAEDVNSTSPGQWPRNKPTCRHLGLGLPASRRRGSKLPSRPPACGVAGQSWRAAGRAHCLTGPAVACFLSGLLTRGRAVSMAGARGDTPSPS